ncbi:hypothetical protein [Nonomuraea sp. B5E05]
MIESPAYRQTWERKEAWYRSGGILPVEDGSVHEGSLILTTDNLDGVDVPQWTELARKVIGEVPSGPVIPPKKKVKKTLPGV